MDCPLCQQPGTTQVLQKNQPHIGKQRYHHCTNCDFVFVPTTDHVSLGAEVARYNEHNNDPADLQYRTFLQPAVDALLSQVAPGQRGLDFGSGPGPTISVMLGERGYTVQNYDPIYAPDADLLEQQYDFILSTETVEHFREPQASWDLLMSLLKPSAPLIVMTQPHPPIRELADWWYLNDPTHIAFYSPATFQWLGRTYQRTVTYRAPSVTLFL